MKVTLDGNGTWWVEDYRIEDSENGYVVYDIGDKLVYDSDSFEGCMTWIWNSI